MLSFFMEFLKILERIYIKMCIRDRYYNPNITDRQEYEKRTAEQKRLIEEMNSEAPSFITMETGRYEPEVFFAAVKGLEQIPEGGERCFCCYEIRLRETARPVSYTHLDVYKRQGLCILSGQPSSLRCRFRPCRGSCKGRINSLVLRLCPVQP